MNVFLFFLLLFFFCTLVLRVNRFYQKHQVRTILIIYQRPLNFEGVVLKNENKINNIENMVHNQLKRIASDVAS